MKSPYCCGVTEKSAAALDDSIVGNALTGTYYKKADLPTLHQGGTGTIEVIVTNSPTTNGDDLQLNVWY